MNNPSQNNATSVGRFAPLLPKHAVHALCPAQQAALAKLVKASEISAIEALYGATGAGRSMVLAEFARLYDGRIITAQEMSDAALMRNSRLSDAAAVEHIKTLMVDHDLLILDDSRDIARANSAVRSEPQQGLGMVLLKEMRMAFQQGNKRLVMGVEHYHPAGSCIEPFSVEDYAWIVGQILGDTRVQQIDFSSVFRFTPFLNGHELRMACELMRGIDQPSTQDFVSAIQNKVLATNIRINEIEPLSLDSLPGAEEIVQKLETHVILPLENRDVAHQLGLKPKRGVLLYGPPGTGKTSIGRALAHRMQGKFFLIDGSFVTEPPAAFFAKLKGVIADAVNSSPSVLFIDDADVLFNIVHISGFARYLLTLLDGLESANAGHVCIMMTAMDVTKVPQALLRSGRIELWLETRAPMGAVRGRVIQRWVGKELPDYQSIDYGLLSNISDGFTPADLRRITGDAKCLYGADLAKQRKPQTAHAYLERAINNLRSVRERMAVVLDQNENRAGSSVNVVGATIDDAQRLVTEAES